jgi:hypothetical protein
MIADCTAPFGPVIFIFPFNNLFDLEFFPLFIPALVFGTGELDYTKAAAPNIGNRIALLQGLPLGNPGSYAVKVNRLARVLVGNGGSDIPYGLAAPGAIGNRERFTGHFWGDPFGPFNNNSPAFVKTGVVIVSAALVSVLLGLTGLTVLRRRSSAAACLPLGVSAGLTAVIPASEWTPAVISSLSAAARNSLLPEVYQEAHC